ncbi:12449_t:CDS:2 [Funneliformis caledonium]|uniref:12449_t:CDS:1 n=1 Tax=Funneliformis caledonium TaxID=1117310 RepID=A0A9N9B2X4_9GLOM|nr:12449_t:CDS:2 [Funneliformis caledonium]
MENLEHQNWVYYAFWNLGLDDDDLEIIHKQKNTGRAFLKTSNEMLGGSATVFVNFAKECKEKSSPRTKNRKT